MNTLVSSNLANMPLVTPAQSRRAAERELSRRHGRVGLARIQFCSGDCTVRIGFGRTRPQPETLDNLGAVAWSKHHPDEIRADHVYLEQLGREDADCHYARLVRVGVSVEPTSRRYILAEFLFALPKTLTYAIEHAPGDFDGDEVPYRLDDLADIADAMLVEVPPYQIQVAGMYSDAGPHRFTPGSHPDINPRE